MNFSAILNPYAIKYADAIWGRLAAENAKGLSDEEIERILGPCVGGHFLVPAAKELRDAGVLYFDEKVCIKSMRTNVDSGWSSEWN